MKKHDWKLASIEFGYRKYSCKNCPLTVRIPEDASKGAISYHVKNAGLSMDCNIENIRGTMEE